MGKSSSSSVSGGGGLAGAVSCGSGGRGGISPSKIIIETNVSINTSNNVVSFIHL